VNVFAQAGLQLYSSSLSLLHSLGWQVRTVAPSSWLRWDLVNYLPRLSCNSGPPNLCLPSS
jgi:hypothetical protein